MFRTKHPAWQTTLAGRRLSQLLPASVLLLVLAACAAPSGERITGQSVKSQLAGKTCSGEFKRRQSHAMRYVFGDHRFMSVGEARDDDSNYWRYYPAYATFNRDGSLTVRSLVVDAKHDIDVYRDGDQLILSGSKREYFGGRYNRTFSYSIEVRCTAEVTRSGN